jgi:hypothetical protein
VDVMMGATEIAMAVAVAAASRSALLRRVAMVAMGPCPADVGVRSQ